MSVEGQSCRQSGRAGQTGAPGGARFSKSPASESPVKVYRNKRGERVFRVANLLEVMESAPKQVESLISVRSLHTSAEAARSEALSKLCIFCDQQVDASVSVILCTKCIKGTQGAPFGPAKDR
ncbi:uncharacterized protein NEMAJ01_1182 [Nematocida major]|uniref:uncharacterized protein n=1 Tax=Nematocida major TaxID=1912982 RepID=UPI002008DA6A|nr:uncharacterized protein NEMAJ01_1182 [Nematocida major]KAH9386286.1 hypothetical protein NEMAJ01_1182 [Nematocida major]